MDQKDCQRRRLVECLTAEISRATGRRYLVQLETLDDERLHEFQRLLRDLDHDKQMTVQLARLQTWRRWSPSPAEVLEAVPISLVAASPRTTPRR